MRARARAFVERKGFQRLVIGVAAVPDYLAAHEYREQAISGRVYSRSRPGS